MSLPADQPRAVIEALGLSPEDLRLLADSLDRTGRVITVGEIAQAEIDARPIHHRYAKPLRRLIEWAGQDSASALTAEQVSAWARRAGDEARIDPRARHGVSAEEAFIQAARAAYTRAIRGGGLRANPAAAARLPERPPSRRVALSSLQLKQARLSAVTHSRDPLLDDLVFQLLRETACRRGGASALSGGDLARDTRTLRLVEKYGKQRWVPVSAHLMTRLADHPAGGCGCRRILHRSDGGHLNAKWFEGFARRIQHLDWAADLGVSPHWIRHTTLTDIERISGMRVAAAYAGHSDHAFGVTGIYTKPSIEELHDAHARLFFDDPSLAADPTATPLLFRRPRPVVQGSVEFVT